MHGGIGGREKWLVFRNRLIAHPRFQKWVHAVPGLRHIARRRTRALFDICGGFIYSQVLYTIVTLGLIEKLAEQPKSIAELARDADMPEATMQRLLRAAVSLDLLDVLDEDRFTLGQLGAAMSGDPAIARMVEHHAMLYADLADPLALLRGETRDTALGRYWSYARSDAPAESTADSVAGYTDLMSASQSFIADDVLDACDFSDTRCLMDVGGGNGTFIRAVASRYPDIHFKLFDLPAVAEKAAGHFDTAGLGARTETHGGSFFSDVLPTGADTVTLVRIVHDHDDENVLRLLEKIWRAIPENGRIIIAEPMSSPCGDDPITDAYFGFYLLAMGSGRARSASEITGMLRKTGFKSISEVPTRRPELVRVLMASKEYIKTEC